jgi:Domain of unknown function (DUF4340)
VPSGNSPWTENSIETGIMKTKGLLIATFVLAALLATLYWSNHHSPSEETAKASLNTPPKILTLKQDDISGLDIRKDGSEVRLAKDGAGQWQITAPSPLHADQDAVSSVLSTISSLDSVRLVDEKPADLNQYGLANPRLEIVVTEKDKSQRLLVGDDTPSGNAVFAKLAADPRVFTLASYNNAALAKNSNDLRDRRLLTADFGQVSQIEFVRPSGGKKQDFTLARNKGAWQILKPKPLRADAGHVEDLVRALRDAKMEVSESNENKVASAFKSAQPFATVKVTGTSGVQELEVRKAIGDYYARSSAISGFYKVAASVGTGLDKKLDDFVNKKLFEFGYPSPDKIEIHDGAKSYFLTHSGSDWWGADGKKLDGMNSEALVTMLRELSATGLADAGFTAPTLQITVTSDAGKRVERVEVAQKGDVCFAKRENEATLYQLPSATILQLKEAAGNIKPQESPKP